MYVIQPMSADLLATGHNTGRHTDTLAYKHTYTDGQTYRHTGIQTCIYTYAKCQTALIVCQYQFYILFRSVPFFPVIHGGVNRFFANWRPWAS